MLISCLRVATLAQAVEDAEGKAERQEAQGRDGKGRSTAPPAAAAASPSPVVEDADPVPGDDEVQSDTNSIGLPEVDGDDNGLQSVPIS